MKTPSFLLLLAAAAQAGPSLTIYNDDLAVIREGLPLSLKAGETPVSYDHATARVIPESVVLRDPEGASAFSILEQGYRNDPVSTAMLLSRYEGQEIEFRNVYPDGKPEVKRGKIIRSGYVPGGQNVEPVIEVDGNVRFGLPGKPLFPALGSDSILRPTLSWTLQSAAPAKFDAQLSYLTGGFSWEATYNLVAAEKSDTLSFTGWVTVSNQSGTSFDQASVKLIAGDVNVVKPVVMDALAAPLGEVDFFAEQEQVAVTEKAFDDFHLYSLARQLTLRDKETKQVEFHRAPVVKAVKKYIYDAMEGQDFQPGEPSVEPPGGEESSKGAAIYWEFRNDESNGLGIPLPAGKVRFYRADDADGNLEFVGENTIEHTPRNEDLKLFTGNAFDVLGSRKVSSFNYSERGRKMDETIEVSLRNRSAAAHEVIVREHLWRWRNWNVGDNSAAFEKIDANKIEFTVRLAPDEEKTVKYTVHYNW